MTPDPLLPPRENFHLEGHSEAEKTLLEAFKSGRMHHAWLIQGPRGIGKATLAYKFARFLLAQGAGGAEEEGDSLFGDPLPKSDPETLDLSEDDPVSRRVAASAHADLMSIEREMDEKKGRRRAEIVVNDVRGVGGFLSMTPAEGGWRVVVIDAADEMNRNAANAVLKVLEEPPRQAVILLVCHNPGRLLPTIRSRCRRLTLNALEDATLISLLQRYAPETSLDDAEALAALSEGSLGRALNLAEEGGLELYQELVDLIVTLPDLDVSKLHKLADKLARAGADEAFRTLGDLLRWWLGRMIQMGARQSLPDSLEPREKNVMEQLLARGGLDRWLEVWEKVGALFVRAQAGDLDRKHVVLTAFLAVERAAKA